MRTPAALALLALPVLAQAPGLDDLARLKGFTAARVSSADPTGGNRDYLKIDPGKTATLADLKGPGTITHIWATISAEHRHLRRITLRLYFDGAETPCVEAPIGDFFGLGHGEYYFFQSATQSIGTKRGLNCWWPMPFRSSARVTATNDGRKPVGAFYYYVDWKRGPVPDDAAVFHARYRQEMPCVAGKPYLLAKAEGRGHYVGCNLSIEETKDGWWGEGDDIIRVDGEEKPLWGTGTEDYFGGAWNFGEVFGYLYHGCPLRGPESRASRWNVYRLHVQDPVPFLKSLEVAIEHGHGNDRADHYSSVGYWYQAEPHKDLMEPMPSADERMPRLVAETGARVAPGGVFIEGESWVGKAKAEGGDLAAQDTGTFGDAWSRSSQLLFTPKAAATWFEAEIEVPEEREWTVSGQFTRAADYGIVRLLVDGNPLGSAFDGFAHSVALAPRHVFGRLKLAAGKHALRFEVTGKNEASTGCFVGLDGVALEP